MVLFEWVSLTMCSASSIVVVPWITRLPDCGSVHVASNVYPLAFFTTLFVQFVLCFDAFPTICCHVSGVTQLFAFNVASPPGPPLVTSVFSQSPIFTGKLCPYPNDPASTIATTTQLRMKKPSSKWRTSWHSEEDVGKCGVDRLVVRSLNKSKIYSANAVGFDRLRYKYVHDVVNHIDCYVKGQVNTNGLENFWSLLKRQLKGTYVAVEPFHLHRYIDEQVFRYNNRATKDNPLDDSDRFLLALSQVSNKRLTFAELTGKGRQEEDF